MFQSQPGGLLFTKFGSNQTALLDLAFPVCSKALFEIQLPNTFFSLDLYLGPFGKVFSVLS